MSADASIAPAPAAKHPRPDVPRAIGVYWDRAKWRARVWKNGHYVGEYFPADDYAAAVAAVAAHPRPPEANERNHPPPAVPPLPGATWNTRTGAWYARWTAADGKRASQRCESQAAAHAIAAAHGVGTRPRGRRPGMAPVPRRECVSLGEPAARPVPGDRIVTREEFERNVRDLRHIFARGAGGGNHRRGPDLGQPTPLRVNAPPVRRLSPEEIARLGVQLGPRTISREARAWRRATTREGRLKTSPPLKNISPDDDKLPDEIFLIEQRFHNVA